MNVMWFESVAVPRSVGQGTRKGLRDKVVKQNSVTQSYGNRSFARGYRFRKPSVRAVMRIEILSETPPSSFGKVASRNIHMSFWEVGDRENPEDDELPCGKSSRALFSVSNVGKRAKNPAVWSLEYCRARVEDSRQHMRAR